MSNEEAQKLQKLFMNLCMFHLVGILLALDGVECNQEVITEDIDCEIIENKQEQEDFVTC